MPDPLLTLLLGTLALAALAAVLWPGRGLLSRLRRHRSADALRQDALKHLCTATWREQAPTLESVAGAVGISTDRAATLLEALITDGLAEPHSDSLALTEAGEREARRIIRAHRLIEHYLAEHTGEDPLDWHHIADLREHETTEADLERLDQALGRPRFDPHGDPIPTPSGGLPPRDHGGLHEAAVGDVLRVVHIEDEPHRAYARIIAEGLHVGAILRVLDNGPAGCRVERDGQTLELPVMVASNLSVRPVSEDVATDQPTRTLAATTLGETVEIIDLAPTCRGLERRRLLDLGILPGTRITAELRSPGGDPVAYRVRGTLIALRGEQAKRVHVRPLTGGTE